jgi:hypothetical protein
MECVRPCPSKFFLSPAPRFQGGDVSRMMGFDDEVGPLSMCALQSPYSCSLASLWVLIYYTSPGPVV